MLRKILRHLCNQDVFESKLRKTSCMSDVGDGRFSGLLVLISTGEVMRTGANDFLLAAAQQVLYN